MTTSQPSLEEEINEAARKKGIFALDATGMVIVGII